MLTALEVGRKIVSLCNANKFKEAHETLYADDVVSVEAGGPPGQDPKSVGLKAVLAKSEWWTTNHTVHSTNVTGPWPHGDRVICIFKMDVTPKVGPMANKRFTMEEAALYTVKNGKVVHEEFFYSMGG